MIETLYFSVEVLTTVGYGDVAPTHSTTRLFAIFHILFGLMVMLSVVGEMLGDIVEQFFDDVVDAIHDNIAEGDSDSKLANFLQRCLILGIMIAFGAAFFHYLEGVPWIDCVYFCVVTVTTIGLGDVTPQTDGGRLFAIFWMLGGVTAMGWTVSAFSEILLERMRHTFHDQLTLGDVDLAKVGGEDMSVDRMEFYHHYIIEKGFMDQVQYQLMVDNFNALDVNGDGEINVEDIELHKVSTSPERKRST